MNNLDSIDNNIQDNKVDEDLNKKFSKTTVALKIKDITSMTNTTKPSPDNLKISDMEIEVYDLSDRPLYAIDDSKTTRYDDAFHICMLDANSKVTEDDTKMEYIEVGIHCHNPIVLPGMYGDTANLLVKDRYDIMFSVIFRYKIKRDISNKVIGREQSFESYILMETYSKVVGSMPVDEFVKHGINDKLFNWIGVDPIKKTDDDLDFLSVFNNRFREKLYKFIANHYGEKYVIQSYHSKKVISFRSPHRKLSSYFVIKTFYAIRLGLGADEMIVFVAQCKSYEDFVVLVKMLRDERGYLLNLRDYINDHFSTPELFLEKMVLMNIASNIGDKIITEHVDISLLVTDDDTEQPDEQLDKKKKK